VLAVVAAAVAAYDAAVAAVVVAGIVVVVAGVVGVAVVANQVVHDQVLLVLYRDLLNDMK
jgi:hypothetical protein